MDWMELSLHMTLEGLLNSFSLLFCLGWVLIAEEIINRKTNTSSLTVIFHINVGGSQNVIVLKRCLRPLQ